MSAAAVARSVPERRFRCVEEVDPEARKVCEVIHLGMRSACLTDVRQGRGRERGEKQTRLIRIHLLEPDYWRRRGLAAALAESGCMEVSDDPESADVVLVALQAVVEASLHANGKPVLAYGPEDCPRKAADALGSGASGYFPLTSGPATLREAIEAVFAGRLWAPRTVLTLMANHQGITDLESQDLICLTMLSEGLSNKEIGSRLRLAEATVKARMNRLYRRFGARSRLQLLAIALRDGIIKP
jgi:DNA-binding NarL/FixJ family response regulator